MRPVSRLGLIFALFAEALFQRIAPEVMAYTAAALLSLLL
jgi:hypothetical protein